MKKRNKAAQKSTNHWFVVASGENITHLKELGFPFFAVRSQMLKRAKEISLGDTVVLYQNAKSSGYSPGIVGLFTATGTAYEARDEVFHGTRSFPVLIPWKARIFLERPLKLTQLIDALLFVEDKKNYGAYLQTALRKLSPVDYQVIAGAVEKLSTVKVKFD